MSGFIVLLWILNFAISCWNLYAVGSSWVEARAVGGWLRFMSWMGAIMTATGFTYCYLMFLAFGAYYGQLFGFGEEQLVLTMQFGFVVLVPGLLFSGFAIWLDSWKRAFQQGGFVNYGVAIYNTWAQYHNTMSAISGWGQAVSGIGESFKAFKSDDDEGKGAAILFCILLVVVALGLGILTTVVGIKKLSASTALPARPKEWSRA